MSRTALPLLVLAFGYRVFAGEELYRAVAESNINQRYTIESIAIAGVQVDEAKLPSSLRQRMNALIGNTAMSRPSRTSPPICAGSFTSAKSTTIF